MSTVFGTKKRVIIFPFGVQGLLADFYVHFYVHFGNIPYEVISSPKGGYGGGAL